MSEEIYFSDGEVHVTNTRAILGEKTFVMANVTSVSMRKLPPNRIIGVLIALSSIPVFLCISCAYFTAGSLTLEDPSQANTFWFLTIILGLLAFSLIVAGIWVAYRARPKYAVVLGSASGEIRAFVSKDYGYIRKIVVALHEAIIKRG